MYVIAIRDKEWSGRLELYTYFDTKIIAMNSPIKEPKIAPDQGLPVIPQVLPEHLPKYPITPPMTAPITAPMMYLFSTILLFLPNNCYSGSIDNCRLLVCDFCLVKYGFNLEFIS
jgi:hypothetical protein